MIQTTIGKLRCLAELWVKKTEFARTSLGAQTDEWEPVSPGGRVWCSIEPMSGNKQLRQDQVQADVTHVIEMRYRDLDPRKHQIRFRGKRYNLVSALNVDGRGTTLRVTAVEKKVG